jgi:hypothetical protein
MILLNLSMHGSVMIKAPYCKNTAVHWQIVLLMPTASFFIYFCISNVYLCSIRPFINLKRYIVKWSKMSSYIHLDITISKLKYDLDDQLETFIEYDFECKKCHHVWKDSISYTEGDNITMMCKCGIHDITTFVHDCVLDQC